MAGKTTATRPEDHVSFTLAKWACELTYESLSPEAIHMAKLFLYDSFGCGLGGSEQHDVHIALDYAKELGGRPTCTVIGSGFKTDPVMAAFLNSLCIRAMDYNDIYWKQDPSHPSDIIPAAMSIAEMNGAKGPSGGAGRDLILGTIIAYEIEMRLCEFALPGIREYGWHHATLTAFASPIVAGRLLGLDAYQIQHAIGISSSHSCTLGNVTAGKLTMMKNTVDPMACRAGVEAALLAKRGYSGPQHALDGKESLTHCFGLVHKDGKPVQFDMSRLTDALPHCPKCHYKVLDCGMKSFPIEALSHAPLSAMMKIVKEHRINPDDVQEIKVEVIARAADILGDPAKYRPNSKETADHSLPYSLAVGLVDGMVTPLQFKDERIRDPKLIPVMDKIKVVANQEFESRFPKYQPSRVTITLKSGKAYTAQVDVPKGDPRDPMTPAEIKVKFDALGAGVIGQKRCDAAGEIIMNVEKEKTLERLMGGMVKQ